MEIGKKTTITEHSQNILIFQSIKVRDWPYQIIGIIQGMKILYFNQSYPSWYGSVD